MTEALTDLHWATFAELDTRTLYALLRLRVDVFVVEQGCCYPELDGRDAEAGTRHVWISEGDEPVAYLRLLDDGGANRIGRVVTGAGHRRVGLADRLVGEALRHTTGPVVLNAQSYLAGWYERFGFEATGPEYDDDGIPHVPMRLVRPR
jgi:ElaA protein